ncbi:MAG: glycoside hydrolase family 2 [Tannerella sp.]|jgi:hypothetical protein|nr:glycoside hydrolase family 2 [Tannerella sp.]
MIHRILPLLFVALITQAQPPVYKLTTDTLVTVSQLRESFANPPAESRLRCYWWWLNSMVTKESITRDLTEMKAKGYGGASIIDAGSSNYDVAHKTVRGPVFLSDEWLVLYKHAVREADRLGIELSVNVQSGWNPGAPSITPEMAQKKLVSSDTLLHGGKHIRIVLSQPETKLLYKDVMVQAIPAPPSGSPVKNDAISNWAKKSFNQMIGWGGIFPLHELRENFDFKPEKAHIINKSDIIDLTNNFDGQTLEWDAPKGEWLVIRYGWTCTGATVSTSSDDWTGLSLDHLNPDAFELFRKTTIQPLVDAAKEAGGSVKYLQTDSWEMGTVNWTNRFPDEFKRFRGYDIAPYMPVMAGMIVESPEASNRFLHDLRKTVSDCVSENHYRLFAEYARSNGMDIHPESGGPHSAPVDALHMLGIGAFPQGEFWARANTHRVTDPQRLAVKQSACAAHTNGKRIVAAEGPTSIGPQWERSPKELKANIDRVFCSGVNRIEWHTFTSSPKEFGTPGNEYFAGTHFNPNVTWWQYAGDFIAYLNRCQYLLQQGLPVSDVLFYYGDDVPNFVFLREEFPELKFGYDWDKCDKRVVLNRLSVENGRIILPDGMSYRLLYLAPEQSIDLDVLKKIESLVRQGMTLVGAKPVFATGLSGFPRNDAELRDIADRMWGDGKQSTYDRKYGEGRILWGQNMTQILENMNVIPDFSFASPDSKTAMDYIHRHTADAEIYFVVNKFARHGINDFEYRYLTDLPDRYEQTECGFRVTGKIPHLWNPQTGELKKVITYREENGQTVLPLHFNPEGSVFVVFTEGKPERHIVEVRSGDRILFPDNKTGAGKNPLFDFTVHEDKLNSETSEAGIYTLKWSDNKTATLNFKKNPKVKNVAGEWKIYFSPEWGGTGAIVTDKLNWWNDLADEGNQYYSGSAVYTTNIGFTKEELKGKTIRLSLGELQEMAVVKLNGRRFPLCWTPPYELDVTKEIKEGDNQLQIEIVNLWPNRLIYDGKRPENQRLTKTNIVKFNAPDAEKLYRKSGLFGPVTFTLY